MAEDDDDFGTGNLGSELETADEIDVFDVASHATDENITDSLVEDDLGRYPRVDAAEDGGFRILTTVGSSCCLRQVVTLCQLALYEPLVAGLEIRQHPVGSQRLLRGGVEHGAHYLWRGECGFGDWLRLRSTADG